MTIFQRPTTESRRLEPEYAASYDAWKALPDPQTSAALIKQLEPKLTSIAKTHTGEANPLTLGKAKAIALSSLPKYDPKTAKLGTFLHEQLKGLRRQVGQRNTILRVPERVALDWAALRQSQTELEDMLGRPPSDAELMAETGFSSRRLAKLRKYNPGLSVGQFHRSTDEGEDDDFSPAVLASDPAGVWERIVYDELDPVGQKIMEWTLGWNGQEVLSNQEIAKRLGRTPGAISQRKAAIQEAIDSGVAMGEL